MGWFVYQGSNLYGMGWLVRVIVIYRTGLSYQGLNFMGLDGYYRLNLYGGGNTTKLKYI